MHFILPYFIIILIVIQLIKKSTRSSFNTKKEYWEREQKANSTRKQDMVVFKLSEWNNTLLL